MGLFRIPDSPPIAAPLAGPDLFEVWDSSAQGSRRITADEMATFFGGGGGTQDLDSVLSNGNTSNLDIILGPTQYSGTGMTSNDVFAVLQNGGAGINFGLDGLRFVGSSFAEVFFFDTESAILQCADTSGNLFFQVNGFDKSATFTTDTFTVGTPVIPDIMLIDGAGNTISFGTSAFDVECDVFRVRPAFLNADMFTVDGVSNRGYFGSGFGQGFNFGPTDTSIEAIDIATISVNGKSRIQTTVGDDSTSFMSISASGPIFSINHNTHQFVAHPFLVQTDTIGKYIPVLEESTATVYALRLDTIIP